MAGIRMAVADSGRSAHKWEQYIINILLFIGRMLW